KLNTVTKPGIRPVNPASLKTAFGPILGFWHLPSVYWRPTVTKTERRSAKRDPSRSKEPTASRFRGGCERVVGESIPFDDQFSQSSKRVGDAHGPPWGDATVAACPN